jgi:hypothetical protein
LDSDGTFALIVIFVAILVNVLYEYFVVYGLIKYAMNFALIGEGWVVVVLIVPIFFVIVGGIYLAFFSIIGVVALFS